MANTKPNKGTRKAIQIEFAQPEPYKSATTQHKLVKCGHRLGGGVGRGGGACADFAVGEAVQLKYASWYFRVYALV